MSVKSKSTAKFLASWVEDGAWGCGREEQLMGAPSLSFSPCLLIPPPRPSDPALFVYVAGLASERPGADDFPRGAKELNGSSSPSASRLVPLGKWEQGWEGCGLRD